MPDPTSADPGEIRVPDVVFWTLSNPGHSSDGQARVSAPRAQWEQLCSDARIEHAVSTLLDEIYPSSVYGTLGNLRQLIDANAALRAELERLRAALQAIAIQECVTPDIHFIQAVDTARRALEGRHA